MSRATSGVALQSQLVLVREEIPEQEPLSRTYPGLRVQRSIGRRPLTASQWPVSPVATVRATPLACEMENPNVPLKTLALKLFALLLGAVVIVTVHHRKKKDKTILVCV